MKYQWLAIALLATGCTAGGNTPQATSASDIGMVDVVAGKETRILTPNSGSPGTTGSFDLTIPAGGFSNTFGSGSLNILGIDPVTLSGLTGDEVSNFTTVATDTSRIYTPAVVGVVQLGFLTTGGMIASGLRTQATVSTSITVTVPAGKQCTAGPIDLYEIISNNAYKVDASLTIGNGPTQLITGVSSGVIYTVKHFLLAFSCPRLRPGATSGLTGSTTSTSNL